MPKREQGASPQVENGYLKVANELVEALYRVDLSPQESRVFWFIIRLTYGWGKKTDWIALSQFTNGIESKGLPGTGIERRRVHRVLVRLRKKRMIVARKDDKNHVSYGIQKDYTKWRGFLEEKTVLHTDDKVSSVRTTKLSSVRAPTINSERNLKQPPLPPKGGDGVGLKELFGKGYREKFNRDYKWSRSEQALVTTDSTAIPQEKWSLLINRFFAIDGDSDRWVAQRGYDYTALHNRWRGLLNGTGNGRPHQFRTLEELDAEEERALARAKSSRYLSFTEQERRLKEGAGV